MTAAALGFGMFLLVWVFFPALVGLLAALCRSTTPSLATNTTSPQLSVIVAAHNEAHRIAGRIQDLLQQSSASQIVEIIVASDGSSDETCKAASALHSEQTTVIGLDLQPQQGRSNAHNEAARIASGDLLVFTDADTTFEPRCLEMLAVAFDDPRVGFASGVLQWRNQGSTDITRSAGLYWTMERKLRQWETTLGLNCFGSGAVCAIRRELYRNIPPIGDVDFTSPLDVRLQGYRCVQVDDAVAVDTMPPNAAAEVRARTRMTAKNLLGTVTRWGLHGVVKHPILTVVLLLHKVGRWLTPIWLLLAVLGSLLLLPSAIGVVLISIEAAAAALVLLGALSAPVPGAAAALSFFLANVAFARGLLLIMTGRVPTGYEPVRSDHA